MTKLLSGVEDRNLISFDIKKKKKIFIRRFLYFLTIFISSICFITSINISNS